MFKKAMILMIASFMFTGNALAKGYFTVEIDGTLQYETDTPIHYDASQNRFEFITNDGLRVLYRGNDIVIHTDEGGIIIDNKRLFVDSYGWEFQLSDNIDYTITKKEIQKINEETISAIK